MSIHSLSHKKIIKKKSASVGGAHRKSFTANASIPSHLEKANGGGAILSKRGTAPLLPPGSLDGPLYHSHFFQTFPTADSPAKHLSSLKQVTSSWLGRGLGGLVTQGPGSAKGQGGALQGQSLGGQEPSLVSEVLSLTQLSSRGHRTTPFYRHGGCGLH